MMFPKNETRLPGRGVEEQHDPEAGYREKAGSARRADQWLDDRVGQRAAELGHLAHLLPGAGSNRAAKGWFHLYASVATSPTIREMASSGLFYQWSAPAPSWRREIYLNLVQDS
jgi:hypothetical protein